MFWSIYRCDVIWSDGKWFEVLWYDVVWRGVVWYDVVWYDVMWCGTMWCGVVWCDVVWYGVVWCDVVWHGVVCYGMMWYGVVWCGVMGCAVNVMWFWVNKKLKQDWEIMSKCEKTKKESLDLNQWPQDHKSYTLPTELSVLSSVTQRAQGNLVEG